MGDNSGIIYDMGEGRYGLAKHKKQHDSFAKQGRVLLEVFLDPQLQQPEKCPTTGKNYVTLKHISKIKQIGFND